MLHRAAYALLLSACVLLHASQPAQPFPLHSIAVPLQLLVQPPQEQLLVQQLLVRPGAEAPWTVVAGWVPRWCEELLASLRRRWSVRT